MDEKEKYEELQEERRKSRLATLTEEAAARVRAKAAEKARKLALKAFKKVFLKALMATTKWIVVTIGGAVVGLIGFWGCLVIIVLIVFMAVIGLVPGAMEQASTFFSNPIYFIIETASGWIIK